MSEKGRTHGNISRITRGAHPSGQASMRMEQLVSITLRHSLCYSFYTRTRPYSSRSVFVSRRTLPRHTGFLCREFVPFIFCRSARRLSFFIGLLENLLVLHKFAWISHRKPLHGDLEFNLGGHFQCHLKINYRFASGNPHLWLRGLFKGRNSCS